MSSTQNIERELFLLQKYQDADSQPIERYTSVILTNQGLPSHTLELAMQPVCRYSSIALESATIHRVFTIADGSDTLNLSTSNGVSINTKLPHGQYDPKELAGMVQSRLNNALLDKAMSDPTVFKEDTTKAQLRTFPKQTVVLPVDLESNYTSTFTYEDGNIPASDINKFVTENPGTISFISATDDFEIKVVRVPVGEVAGVRVVSSTDLTILASTMVISVFSSDPLVAHVLNLPDLAAEDGSAIRAEKRGDFEYCYKCIESDPDGYPLPVICAVYRAQKACVVVAYEFGPDRYYRVTSMVEGPTAVLPVPTTLLSVCKALTAPIPRVVQGVGDGFHINPDSPMNNVNYEFVVHSGADMASLIKAATKQPVYELPVMTPPGEAPTDWSSPESLQKILPETYLLAHMYLGMFPQSLDANDPYSHHRLLAQIQTNPDPIGGLLKDTLAITMKPTYRLSDYVSTLNSSLYGKLMFTLSGSAAKALGLPDVARGVDPAKVPNNAAGALTNAPHASLVTTVFGKPLGMGVDGTICHPQRLLVHATLNGKRVQGNVYGTRPLAVVPTRKAYNDVWEPKMPTCTTLDAPVERIGLVVENERGVPVAGEYTFVLRLK